VVATYGTTCRVILTTLLVVILYSSNSKFVETKFYAAKTMQIRDIHELRPSGSPAALSPNQPQTSPVSAPERLALNRLDSATRTPFPPVYTTS